MKYTSCQASSAVSEKPVGIQATVFKNSLHYFKEMYMYILIFSPVLPPSYILAMWTLQD